MHASFSELPYDVFRQLSSEGVPLRECANLGEGMAAARWFRDETARTSYQLPNHHTLSLYIAGGDQIRRVSAAGEARSFGAGSLCLMPEGVTSDWLVAGSVDLFHLYVPNHVYERTVTAALDRDPANIVLDERVFFVDPMVETVIRATFLTKAWTEPAERLALSYAGHMLLAHLIGHYSTANENAFICKGGLAPNIRCRVVDYIEAHLGEAIRIHELAAIAGLSEFHFARMFKVSTGQTPHGYVRRRRMERARHLLSEAGLTVSEVALACGFVGQSHFATQFRKYTGLTPRQFRNANQ